MNKFDYTYFLTNGYSIVENVFPISIIEEIRKILPNCIERAQDDAKNESEIGRLIFCPCYDLKFIELLENDKFLIPFETILGKNYYLYTYSSSCLPPHSGNFSSKIHVDRRVIIPGYVEMVGALVLINDFTEENGATWYLPKYFDNATPPSEDLFYKKSKRLIAKAGSVFYFNSTLWHSGGINKTNVWRHALALAIVRPYLKQRLDIPSMLRTQDLSPYSKNAKKILGFNSEPPKSITEYYSKCDTIYY